MPEDLVARWREDIVGEWRQELTGTDLLDLGPVADRFRHSITLRVDGTASWDIPELRASLVLDEPTPPFPVTWRLAEDRVLSILIPIAPMPDYGLPDWTQDAFRYDVLAVSDRSLGLSSRRFDGESILILRRVK